VDARRDELRAVEGGNGIGCHDVGKRREGNRRGRVDAMTLTRAGVTAIVGAHRSMFRRSVIVDARRIGASRFFGCARHVRGPVGRMRRAINLRPSVGRVAHCVSRLAYSPSLMRHCHMHRRRLSNLELQPDHQLKRQQNQQHGFRRADFGGWTTSHRSELTPRTRRPTTGPPR
jgi:hypothetical protein